MGNTWPGVDWVAGVTEKGNTRYEGHVMSEKGNFDGLNKRLWDPQWGENSQKGNCRSCDLPKREIAGPVVYQKG